MVFVVNGGDTISPIKTLFIIFKIEVWIMIIVSLGLTTLALWLIFSFDKKQFSIFKFADIWFNVFLATIWGYFVAVPKNIKARYIIMCYLVYQIHIQTGFTSNLVNVLTTPQYEPGIQNLEELVKSNLSIITTPFSENYFTHVEKSNSIYSKIKKQLQYRDLRNSDRMSLLNNKNCAVLALELEVDYYEYETGEKMHVNRIEATLVTGSVHSFFAMGPGHYFTETLNSFMRSMDESGIQVADEDGAEIALVHEDWITPRKK
ncbi:hypothetical protein RN001_011259 [Aquatica leii]|uniref:Ionotropic glutamate receptor C-terminal domain-containing protein n=1 Tax=Aquatica leii TaxID=1421715 RepID=A0AAN7P8X7_9COLE|nr:hypothetical protein RN001_011259 [Aquatica leii]